MLLSYWTGLNFLILKEGSAVSVRLLLNLLLVSCFLVPATSVAQVVEEHETELILPKVKVKLTGERPDLDEVAKLLLSQTNEFRISENRPPVTTQPELQATARYFADFMASTNKYGHAADETQAHERAKKHGYQFCIVSENIAYQFSSTGFTAEKLSKGFTEGWKKSPGHRKNMVDPDVTEIGLAVSRSEETGYYFAVQMFGRPKSATITFEVANESEVELEYRVGERKFALPPAVIRTHQSCRPSELTFRWPGSETDAETVKPKPGQRLTITKVDGKFVLK